MPYPAFLDVAPVRDPRYLVVPIPYDGTSTYRKGADAGPRALLEASSQVELYDIETDSEPYTEGIRVLDREFDFSTPESMAASVRDAFREIFRGDVFPLALGGEHSISAGIIEAAAEVHPELTVVQFDAHADLREDYEGSRYNHACVMARAADVARIVQVGIRSMDAGEKERMDRNRVVFAHAIAAGEDWIPRMLEAAGSGPVYITIDLDALDPSIMGATGTPEPGGMGWYDLLAGLAALFKNNKVIGADIVELCPNGDHAPEFAAAKLAYKTICYHTQYGGRHG